MCMSKCVYKWVCVCVCVCECVCVCALTYTTALMCSGAVHRYYESRRRLFNDSRPGRKDTAKEVKERSKKTTLRKKASNSCCLCTVIVVHYVGCFIYNYSFTTDGKSIFAKPRSQTCGMLLTFVTWLKRVRETMTTSTNTHSLGDHQVSFLQLKEKNINNNI